MGTSNDYVLRLEKSSPISLNKVRPSIAALFPSLETSSASTAGTARMGTGAMARVSTMATVSFDVGAAITASTTAANMGTDAEIAVARGAAEHDDKS